VGLRRRLNRLESHAHRTMGNANQAIDTAEAQAAAVGSALYDLIADVKDGLGVDVTLVHQEGVNLFEEGVKWLKGEIEELPVSVRLKLDLDIDSKGG